MRQVENSTEGTAMEEQAMFDFGVVAESIVSDKTL